MWAGFIVFVICCTAIDFFLLGGNKDKHPSFKSSLSWSLIWFVLALAFGAFVFWDSSKDLGVEIGKIKLQEYLAGYLIEKSLSVDNLFVFLMIFQFFHVPPQYQKRVLEIGILTALVLRFLMILAGSVLITQFSFILYIFALVLIVSGVKMVFSKKGEKDLSDNFLLKFIKKRFPTTDKYHGNKFLVRINKKLYLTPLFLVLIFIEVSDVVFALDSIPAVFAITQDPFIVFTSNIFAILGLRALYFLLAGMEHKFHYLKIGLAFILVFIGIKMLIVHYYKIPAAISLTVVITAIVLSIVLSLVFPPKNAPTHS